LFWRETQNIIAAGENNAHAVVLQRILSDFPCASNRAPVVREPGLADLAVYLSAQRGDQALSGCQQSMCRGGISPPFRLAQDKTPDFRLRGNDMVEIRVVRIPKTKYALE
jgi:hypothetical protein